MAVEVPPGEWLIAFRAKNSEGWSPESKHKKISIPNGELQNLRFTLFLAQQIL